MTYPRPALGERVWTSRVQSQVHNLIGQIFNRLPARVCGIASTHLVDLLLLCGVTNECCAGQLRLGAKSCSVAIRRGTPVRKQTKVSSTIDRFLASSSPEVSFVASMIQRWQPTPTARLTQNSGGPACSSAKRWISIQNFLAYIGRRPTPNHTRNAKQLVLYASTNLWLGDVERCRLITTIITLPHSRW